MRTFFKILEIFWLVAALVSAGICVYYLILKDSGTAFYFVFVFIISAIMYLLRRYQRKNQDRLANNEPRR